MLLLQVSCKHFSVTPLSHCSLFPSWTPLQPATKGNPAENMEALGVGAAPLQRPGMPIEVAVAYVFLASPMGSYFTGEIIHGSGGIEMQG